MSITAAQLVTKISTEGMGQAQSDINTMSGAVSKASGFLKTALIGASVAAGAAVIGLGVQSVKMAGDFQEGMTSLVTGAGESAANLKLVSDGILNLATQTGSATKDLTDGMYMIESAGFHGAAGLDVLKAASMGAKVGSASLADVANGVTTAMTDYAKSGLTASQATNTLIATVAAGKTHMGDLANAMSSILPTSASVGVSFKDVSAAMATMTGEGTPAADAATYLRQTLMSLENPASAGVSALKSIGLTSKEVSNEMKVSLPDTLALITDHLKKKFPEGSAAYVKALADIAGGSRQMQGMLELTGDHLKTFAGNVTQIGDAVKKGGNDITGWNKVTEDFNFKISQMREQLETAGIKIGTMLLPIIGRLADFISTNIGPIVQHFMDLLKSPQMEVFASRMSDLGNALLSIVAPAFGTSTDKSKNFFDFLQTQALPALGNLAEALANATRFLKDHASQIGTVAAIIGTLYVPAAIKAGVESAIAGVKIAVQFVANIIKVGIEGLAAVGKLTMFIAQLIASGVQATIAGAKIAASFVASLVTTAAQAVATGAVIAGKFIITLVQAAAQAVVTGATFLASLVPALISVVAEAVVAAVTAIPALVAGFAAWVVGAGAAAIATIAATWPILAIIAALALLGLAIYEVVTHWSQITAFLQDKWQAFTTWFIGKWNDIVSFFKALPGKALGWASDMIGQFVAGIENGIGAVGNAIGKVANTIKAFLHFSKPDMGPLADADQWMPDMMETFSRGMNDHIGKVKAAAGNVSLNIASSIQPALLPVGTSAIGQSFAQSVASSHPASSGTLQPIILQVDQHQLGRIMMPIMVNKLRHNVGVMGQ